MDAMEASWMPCAPQGVKGTDDDDDDDKGSEFVDFMQRPHHEILLIHISVRGVCDCLR
jgi:hypothetical protein